MKVFGYRDNGAGEKVLSDIFDIMVCTYSGKDMGERKITATIKWPTRIDFQIGDYIELPMQNLLKEQGKYNGGVSYVERFYIYVPPTIKKTASSMSVGDAFEHTVTFYPPQYELSMVRMRDFIQDGGYSVQGAAYTGFDSVAFLGGANALMKRIQACLDVAHENGTCGKWEYKIADAVNEDINSGIEYKTFQFSGNSVADAIQYLNKEDYCNTTFFVNGRTIYVGFHRPYFCTVNEDATLIVDKPLNFKYGKTSHLPVDIDHGGLFDITKTIGNRSPITRLYAYGASRNLNRYYNADKIKSGRYVKSLMLPSFSNDGKTDFIDSTEAIERFGIREGSKTFDEIYPSLRYVTYGDLRRIKYCIKIKGSGLQSDGTDVLERDTMYNYAVARAQCYKVVPSENPGINKLVECAPEHDIAIIVHATGGNNGKGKLIKTVLYGGATDNEALMKQRAADRYVPDRKDVATQTDPIPGSCFLVHDYHWADLNGEVHTAEDRTLWFTKPEDYDDENPGLYPSDDAHNQAQLHRIEYVDTFWLTDVYIMQTEGGHVVYDQQFFNREGYSAYCYARFNDTNKYPDSTPVGEIVGVEPITLTDTSELIENGGGQASFDVYIRDIGFELDEQNDFGEMVHIVNGNVKFAPITGNLVGMEFESERIPNQANGTVVPAYLKDGSFNNGTETIIPFRDMHDSQTYAHVDAALNNGAAWRIRLLRIDNGENFTLGGNSVGVRIPTKEYNMNIGDRFVLLDVYMPDVYIHAAEQRLYQEAHRYLDKVDNGDLSYSLSIDKVRMQQIPLYALQMREGVNMRVIDEDLEIESKVKNVELFSLESGFVQTETPYKVEYTEHTIIPNNFVSVWQFARARFKEGKYIIPVSKEFYPYFNKRTQFYTEVKTPSGRYTTHSFTLEGYDVVDYKDINVNYRAQWSEAIKTHTDDYVFVELDFLSFDCMTDEQQSEGKFVMAQLVYSLYTDEKVPLKAGDKVEIAINNPINFDNSKYYNLKIAVERSQILRTDFGSKYPKLYIATSTNTRYEITDCTIIEHDTSNGMTLLEYSFYIESVFDASMYSKVCVEYSYRTGQNDYKAILYSVNMKNIDAEGDEVKYVDMKVESCTIEIHDNTRDNDKRIVEHRAEPIKIISATVKEVTNASSWAALMNQVDEDRIETEANSAIVQGLVNSARTNYNKVANLRNAIFDPDGTCNQTFLQVMMMQVGADSMNFMMNKTYQDASGGAHNYRVDNKLRSFQIFNDDTLTHYVFTGGHQGGVWSVPGNVMLRMSGTQVYYVCIKADKNSATASWVIDTQQHAYNEDPDFWYFNFGILTIGDSGYEFTETRGNAYMYGDSLVCGKISSLAKNSWFDLNTGNFVIGNTANGAALEYINGKLTISNSFGFSTIDGGTMLTNLMQMVNEDDEIVAGMSGKTDSGLISIGAGKPMNSNGVAMWAGGTYEEALNQAMGIANQLGKILPILLTKRGIGSRIGCFEVISDSAVRVTTGTNSYIDIDTVGGITVKSNDGEISINTNDGITVKNAAGDICTVISNKPYGMIDEPEDGKFKTVICKDGIRSGSKYVYFENVVTNGTLLTTMKGINSSLKVYDGYAEWRSHTDTTFPDGAGLILTAANNTGGTTRRWAMRLLNPIVGKEAQRLQSGTVYHDNGTLKIYQEPQ